MSLRDSDRLCDTCAKVKFRALEEGCARQSNQQLEFDEFWDFSRVLNETNCPLCRLLIWCFQTDGSFDLAEVGKLDLLCGVYIGHELQVFLEWKERDQDPAIVFKCVEVRAAF